MNKNSTYRSPGDKDREPLERLHIPFSVGEEEAWNRISSRIGELENNKQQILRKFTLTHYLAAASLALLVSLTVFLRFYHTDIQTTGETASLVLPGGSTIELHQNSQIKYHSLWWRVKRISYLEGTAAFEVEKGRPFEVRSAYGSTRVLGTRFLVDAKVDQYMVKCFSGSVKVFDSEGKVEAILNPNEEVTIDEQGNFKIRYFEPETDPADAEEGYLRFEGIPVTEVFRVLEKSFNVRIEMTGVNQPGYSGIISRKNSLEDILAAICIPLDLKYERKSRDHYIVSSR